MPMRNRVMFNDLILCEGFFLIFFNYHIENEFDKSVNTGNIATWTKPGKQIQGT